MRSSSEHWRYIPLARRLGDPCYNPVICVVKAPTPPETPVTSLLCSYWSLCALNMNRIGEVEKVANNTVIDCWIITSADDEEEVVVVVCIDKDNNTSSTTVKEIDGNNYYFCQVNEWVQSEQQRVLKHIEKATTSTTTTTTVTCVAFECPCS